MAQVTETDTAQIMGPKTDVIATATSILYMHVNEGALEHDLPLPTPNIVVSEFRRASRLQDEKLAKAPAGTLGSPVGKAVAYKVGSVALTFAVAYAFTGTVEQATGLMIVGHAVTFGWYVILERVWKRRMA